MTDRYIRHENIHEQVVVRRIIDENSERYRTEYDTPHGMKYKNYRKALIDGDLISVIEA